LSSPDSAKRGGRWQAGAKKSGFIARFLYLFSEIAQKR
jgi:hypothetical protein